MVKIDTLRLVLIGLSAVVSACSMNQPVSTRDPVSSSAAAAAHRNTAAQWLDQVADISTHGDSEGRRQSIRSVLSQWNADVTAMPFSARELEGINLVANISGGADAPLLLIGAHLDQVAKGHGVTDNAAGCGVVLALAERFRQQPLARHRVAVAFWDLEERGLLGAHAYVAQESPQPALYVNVDVFGWGDTIWMMTPDDAHPLVAATRHATDAIGIRFVGGPDYPPSDHLAFLDAGWPAVSYSLVGNDEIAPILQVFAKQQPATMPKVMDVIHSERDTLEQVDADAAAKGIDAIERALRRWDAQMPAG